MELDDAIKILKGYRGWLNGSREVVIVVRNVEKALGVVLDKYEEELSIETKQANCEHDWRCFNYDHFGFPCEKECVLCDLKEDVY